MLLINLNRLKFISPRSSFPIRSYFFQGVTSRFSISNTYPFRLTFKENSFEKCSLRSLSQSHHSLLQKKSSDENEKYENLSLSKKFKRMWKNYWYVLLPVHVSTSIVWFGSFYLMCKSGIDVASFLHYLGASEEYVHKLSTSDMGYYALAYACYKIATPARYTVTLGGTTATIKILSDKGYLKTTSEISTKVKESGMEMKEVLEERKEEIKGQYKDKKLELKVKIEERKEDIMEKYSSAKIEVQDRVKVKKNEYQEIYKDKKKDIQKKLKKKD